MVRLTLLLTLLAVGCGTAASKGATTSGTSGGTSTGGGTTSGTTTSGTTGGGTTTAGTTTGSTSAGGSTTSGTLPGDTTVGDQRFVGRFAITADDPALPRIDWGGTQVITRFNGTGLSATLTDNNSNNPDYASAFDIVVDGVVSPTTLTLDDGEKTYSLVSGLPAGEHTVVLYRRNEAAFSSPTLIGAFTVTGGSALAPPTPATRRIEFVGDSSITGWGIECASAGESYTAPTQNERKTYPALVSAALNAEHVNLGYSGKGVTRNFDQDTNDNYIDLYARAWQTEANPEWGFSAWQPDLVWIALGGNDFGSSPVAPLDGGDGFIAKYKALVTLVRTKNPNAHIMCTVEGRLNDVTPTTDSLKHMHDALNAVVDELTAAGDTKISYFELPRADEDDLTGCDGHANEAFHATAATAAEAEIRSKMGW